MLSSNMHVDWQYGKWQYAPGHAHLGHVVDNLSATDSAASNTAFACHNP